MGLSSSKRGAVEIWPEQPRIVGEQVEIRARIETGGSGKQTLWYRLPAVHQPSITDSLDPFVIGTVMYGMRRGTSLRAHGRVSPSLMRNLEEFQAAWRCWMPDVLREVPVHADTESEDPRVPGDDTLMTFSGGLDSCFTAWRHTQGLCGRRRRNLKAAMMVHGFDIPLAEADIFQRAAENSRKLVESIGLELIPVTCNFRELGDEWEQAHGAALASCLHLLRRRFPTAMVASSHVYNALRFPWGSNPLTDVMLATESLSIVYDGGDYTRREKAREVAAWSEAMARVRVCWAGDHKDRNCGTCVRCVGTAICFAVEGKPVPTSLPIESLDEAIRALTSTRLKPVVITRLDELLQAARLAGIRDSWVGVLEECIAQQRGRSESGLAKITYKLRDRLRRAYKRVKSGK